jgi:hypothetical protein
MDSLKCPECDSENINFEGGAHSSNRYCDNCGWKAWVHKSLLPATTSDGVTADYYELPPRCKQLQDLISFRDMNAQMGEIFRANYRYGKVSHSDKLRDIN